MREEYDWTGKSTHKIHGNDTYQYERTEMNRHRMEQRRHEERCGEVYLDDEPEGESDE